MVEGQEPHRAFALPPGCRFYPSEELLLRYYLTKKNNNEVVAFEGADLIKELNLYDHDPFELPDSACFFYGAGGRKPHWFCFTVRNLNVKRDTNTGFWLRKGGIKDIPDGTRNVILGSRTHFVFYAGNSARTARRTEWNLFEYALVNQLPDSFVLCRVFLKRQRNRGSETGQSAMSEESSSAVRNIGIQHDVGVPPVNHINIHHHNNNNTNTTTNNNNNNINVNLRIENVAPRADEEGDREDVAAPPPPVVAPPREDNQQERLYANHEDELLRAIREEDFLELNDLV